MDTHRHTTLRMSAIRGQRSTENGQEVDRGGLCWCLTAISGAEENLPPGQHFPACGRTQTHTQTHTHVPRPLFVFAAEDTHVVILMRLLPQNKDA